MVNKKYNIPQTEILKHKKDMKQMEIGFLGNFFGEKDIPRNVGGFIAIILVIAIIFFNKNSELINLIIPVLTLILGYLFGQKTNQN